MADEHFRTPAFIPGTHCQNICDKPLQSNFSSALYKRFYSGNALETFLFNGLYKFTLLTYLFTWRDHISRLFCFCDLDIDPTTFICELDLTILNSEDVSTFLVTAFDSHRITEGDLGDRRDTTENIPQAPRGR